MGHDIKDIALFKDHIGWETRKPETHTNHEIHYWIRHKDGYLFCKCGARK